MTLSSRADSTGSGGHFNACTRSGLFAQWYSVATMVTLAFFTVVLASILYVWIRRRKTNTSVKELLRWRTFGLALTCEVVYLLLTILYVVLYGCLVISFREAIGITVPVLILNETGMMLLLFTVCFPLLSSLRTLARQPPITRSRYLLISLYTICAILISAFIIIQFINALPIQRYIAGSHILYGVYFTFYTITGIYATFSLLAITRTPTSSVPLRPLRPRALFLACTFLAYGILVLLQQWIFVVAEVPLPNELLAGVIFGILNNAVVAMMFVGALVVAGSRVWDVEGRGGAEFGLLEGVGSKGDRDSRRYSSVVGG